MNCGPSQVRPSANTSGVTFGISQVAGRASPGNSTTLLISIDPSLCAFISSFHEQGARKARQRARTPTV
jgi:hypothetical protein